MASNLTPAGTIANGIEHEFGPGWDEDSQLELALQFISEGGDYMLCKWREFLAERAQEECEHEDSDDSDG